MRQGSHREGRFLLGFAGFLSGVLCCAQMARVSEIQGSLLPRWKREAGTTARESSAAAYTLDVERFELIQQPVNSTLS